MKTGSSVSRVVLGNDFREATRGWIAESIFEWSIALKVTLCAGGGRVSSEMEVFTGNRQKDSQMAFEISPSNGSLAGSCLQA